MIYRSIYLYTPKILQINICKIDGLLTFWASPGRFYLATVFIVTSHSSCFIEYEPIFIHDAHLVPLKAESTTRQMQGNMPGTGGTGAGMKLTGNKIFPLARWYTTVVLMALEERTVDCNNNLYFKRLTPITIKSILPSGPLKT